MSTSPTTGAGSVAGINNFSGMDLETALMAVQSERANQLETQLKGQLDAVQARNTNIAKLNNVLSALNSVDAKFPADAKPTDQLGSIKGWKDNDYAVAREYEATVNSAIADAKLDSVFKDNGSKGQISLNPREWGFVGGLNSERTKADISAAIGSIKSLIDAQGNSQQMDMLRLQSLSNKRNEAFDIMTNFVKKMQDSRSSILQKM
ncbi:hypothetical protein RY831_16345 [Noviherbaspirillum sp. CPCC 100848]|uniref:Secreted protein n=1 Tax=Noviherbaspirillum album TaxID=3080276 RepID=A0ABU6JB26_9BURK|nr:hypothetical protein [Noviherbaspirillum sp. CPCC 100848]MEC4720735.1 hypothetical protein [Noviherbaspirillum sp. CPCC 100848]